MNMLEKYLIDEALILIPVLVIIGGIIKQTPKMSDWVIPYILLILGVVFSVALMGLSAEAVIQGVLVSGGSVLAYELYTQAKEGD